MENIAIEQRSEGEDILVTTLKGRLDAAAALDLRQHLKSAIDEGGPHLIVDMAAVDFVDSTGLSVLITALKNATAAGGDVILASLTPTVRSIMELTRLDRVFHIHPDVKAALQSMQSVPQS